MGKKSSEGYGVSDELWEKVSEHVPRRKNTHPCGGGRKPADARRAFAAIYFVWRTGSQWKALDATGIMPGSTAHGVFQRWVKAGVFERMWKAALGCAAELGKLDWSFVSIDGCMTKAPLGGEKNRAKSDRPRQEGHQAEPGHRRGRGPARRGGGRSQPQRP
jgi:transposase